MKLKKLPDRLNEFVSYTGLTREEFAVLIGKKSASVYNYLKGSSILDISQLIAIKKEYQELNIEWFLFGEGDMILDKKPPKDNKEEFLIKRVLELEYLVQTQKELISFLKKSEEQTAP